jgi:hypothetical protein
MVSAEPAAQARSTKLTMASLAAPSFQLDSESTI